MAEFPLTRAVAGALARAAIAAAVLTASGAPARADVAQTVADMILPAYDTLAASTAALDRAARDDCAPAALRAPYQAAWDAWARIDFLRIGPVETDGRALAMAFWPDPKSSGPRAQQALIDAGLPGVNDPAAFGDLSAALRGLAGLERLIYPSAITGDDAALCALRRATATDLAAMAAAIRADWDAFAPQLLDPGAAGNTAYLTADESRQALLTQIVTGLDHLADTRLGRPMGRFDAPRPDRAEAAAAGRSLRNVVLSLQGLRDAALTLYPDAPQTRDAFGRALTLAQDIDDPVLAGVAAPVSRIRIEALQQAIRAARDTVQSEIGGAMGLSVGFNSKDGD